MTIFNDTPGLVDVELPLTQEQLDAEMDDLIAENWVDPMEIEEPALDEQSEFLHDCN